MNSVIHSARLDLIAMMPGGAPHPPPLCERVARGPSLRDGLKINPAQPALSFGSAACGRCIENRPGAAGHGRQLAELVRAGREKDDDMICRLAYKEAKAMIFPAL